VGRVGDDLARRPDPQLLRRRGKGREENRHALATVALGTGRSAHQEAECTLSAKIPATVAWLK
jgi:hypothetical protein